MVVSSNARDGSNDTEDVGENDGSSDGPPDGVFMLLLESYDSVAIVFGTSVGMFDLLKDGASVGSELGIVEVSLGWFKLGNADFAKVGLDDVSLLGSFEGNVDGRVVGPFVSLLGTEVCSLVGGKVGLDEGGSVLSRDGSLDGCCDGLAFFSFDNVGLLDGCILGAFV
jgi:hypothetical protein